MSRTSSSTCQRSSARSVPSSAKDMYAEIATVCASIGDSFGTRANALVERALREVNVSELLLVRKMARPSARARSQWVTAAMIAGVFRVARSTVRATSSSRSRSRSIAESTSIARTTNTIRSGGFLSTSAAIDASGVFASSASAGSPPSCRPRVSRMESVPRSLECSYHLPRPVCAFTWPTSATFFPKRALTSDDFPDPRRPTSSSAGGRLSRSVPRSVAMRWRRFLTVSDGMSSSICSSRRIVSAMG